MALCTSSRHGLLSEATASEDIRRPRKTPKLLDGRGAAQPSGPQRAKNQDRVNRKREQNRISQKCMREKRLACASQLDDMAEVIKLSSQGQSEVGGDAQNAGLARQLALIEENRDIKDALLRMRKKMLSLSYAAAAVADDPIFEQIIFKAGSRKTISGEQTEDLVVGKEDTQVEDDGGDYDNGVESSGATLSHSESADEGQKTLSVVEMAMSDPTRPVSANKSSVASSWSTASLPRTPEDTIAVASGPRINANPEPPQPDMLDDIPDSSIDNLCFPESTIQSYFSSIFQNDVCSNFQFSPELHYQVPPVKVKYERTAMIVEACQRYLQQVERLPPQPLGSAHGSRNPFLSQLSNSNPLSQSRSDLAADVAKIGFKLICEAGRCTDYIYGIGKNAALEKILHWKLSPSTATRLAIPEPFQPTNIQLANHGYPVSIDFLNFPTIRDQLITKFVSYEFNPSYDLNQVLCDIVANTVIEVPEIRAAVNIHDAFFTRIFSQSGTTDATSEYTTVTDSLLPASDFPEARRDGGNARSKSPEYWTLDDVLARIGDEINELRRLRSRTNPRLSQWTTPYALPESSVPSKHPLASKWRLDDVKQWKMGRDFAATYPEIDCVAVAALYPTYASKWVPDLGQDELR